MSNIELIQNALTSLPSITKQEGKEYFEQNHVNDLNYYPNAHMLSANVNGYRVKIDLKNRKVNHCSCYFKTECKHVAATLYAASDPHQSQPVKKITQDFAPSVESWLMELDQPHPSEKTLAHVPNQLITKETNTKILFILQPTKQLPLSLETTICIGKLQNGRLQKNKITTVTLLELYTTKPQHSENIIELLSIFLKKNQMQNKHLSFDFDGGIDTLKKIIELNCCYFKTYENESSLSWGNPIKGYFEWEVTSSGLTQKLVCKTSPVCMTFLGFNPPCYLNQKSGEIGLLYFEGSLQKVQSLLKMPEIDQKDVFRIHELISAKDPLLIKDPPKEIKTTIINQISHPCLSVTIDENDDDDSWQNNFMRNIFSYDDDYEDEEDEYNDSEKVVAKLSFMYGPYEISINERAKSQTIIDKEGEISVIQRDLVAEKKAIDLLAQLGWHCEDRTFSLKLDNLMDSMIEFMQEQKKHLEDLGWAVRIDREFPIQSIYETDDWYIQGNESINDWFDVELGTLIDGKRVNMIPFLSKLAAERNKKGGEDILELISEKDKISFMVEGGQMIIVSAEKVRNILEPLLVEFENEDSLKPNGQLRLSKWSSAVLNEMDRAEGSVRARWIGSETLRGFIDKIKGMQTLPEITLPKELNCELRPYQLAGVSWLQFLTNSDLNGILADDMGLGKTVQTLTHILIEKESGRMKSPVLIIAPTSLMSNWFSEAEKFTPSLKVLILQGANRHASFKNISENDIVLTTYPLLIRDKENYLIHHFHMLIVDEAQMIKNAKTQAYQILQQFHAKHRLCLTGTPMENHLGEIWSLFNFLLPGFLGNERKFQVLFRRPIEKENSQARQLALNQRLRPFMLRRTKQEVIIELPEKTEIIQKIDLNSEQQDLYEAVRLKAQERVMKAIAQKGLERSQIAVLDALLKLRQVCCDPRLLKMTTKTNAKSAKLAYLMEILPQMIEEKRKILIFSQFTSMLSLIEEELKRSKIPYSLLTGSTIDRKGAVNDFQNGTLPVMLLSLKAGGVGLNLTAADTVIHYDPWWNPSVENQATDRAHRMGQKRNVFVYKLIMNGTLEEKILAMQEKKKALVAALLDSKSTEGLQFSMEDLEQIFKPLSM